MKALTLWQPWASLIMGGFKTYETRSWSTSHRGLLAIHAARKEPRWVSDLLNRQLNDANRLFWHCLTQMGYEAFPQLPRGKILGLVEINGILRVEEIRHRVTEMDLAFGDFSDGRFAWRINNIIPFDKPISVRGHQGLWEWAQIEVGAGYYTLARVVAFPFLGQPTWDDGQDHEDLVKSMHALRTLSVFDPHSARYAKWKAELVEAALIG